MVFYDDDRRGVSLMSEKSSEFYSRILYVWYKFYISVREDGRG
jgi:hypothetical protein